MDVSRLAVLSATGLTSAALAGVGLLVVEAALTVRRGFLSPDTAPAQEGVIGDPSRPVLRLAMLGDSTAAGVGVSRPQQTVGRQLAVRLARHGRCVQLTASAVAGSRVADLGPQVSRALLGQPDVAVLLVGANDATHGTRLEVVSGQLREAVGRIRAAHVPVVVGTCPDLGSAPAWPQPLRSVIGWRGHQVAQVQIAATQAAGGVCVDLGAATGAIFRADRGTFSEDGFHPSADGYRLWAEALLPAVADAASAPATL